MFALGLRDGESSLNIIGIRATVHLPYDHSLLVQNLTGQGFNNASVPASAQGFFPLHLYCQQVPTVWSRSFLPPLEFPYLFSLIYGFRGVYRAYPRELPILSHSPANGRRKSRVADSTGTAA
ncbi:hypothetical protein SAY86_030165 [Trapa natans]|uniref:Uncharacterized protein n=1 Tax=Trapa natans TaxID=22666 RepID=A0AAN7RAC3_TRANT|nr:hypothetical protein SAY86_030165 [Trapa natans]